MIRAPLGSVRQDEDATRTRRTHADHIADRTSRSRRRTLMVRTTSDAAKYRTIVTNGRVDTRADTMKGSVGSFDGFRPHELLEAAVAACMNISARLKADAMGLGPVDLATEVSLDRSRAGWAVFRCRVRVGGALTQDQRAAIKDAAFHCAVCQTLLRECAVTEDDEQREA
jgi:putative redox protein